MRRSAGQDGSHPGPGSVSPPAHHPHRHGGFSAAASGRSRPPAIPARSYRFSSHYRPVATDVCSVRQCAADRPVRPGCPRLDGRLSFIGRWPPCPAPARRELLRPGYARRKAESWSGIEADRGGRSPSPGVGLGIVVGRWLSQFGSCGGLPRPQPDEAARGDRAAVNGRVEVAGLRPRILNRVLQCRVPVG